MTSRSRAVIAHGPMQLEVGEVQIAPLGPDDVLVRVHAGGICGSDLHYYLHGGFGAVRIRAPMVLGHELSGAIETVGAAVTTLRPGDRVAVNPSLACGQCEQCRAGFRNHCLDMRFLGSAMRTPHVDGGFRDWLVCKAVQAVPIPDHLGFGEAALAEPLAVCLHAVSRAGSLVGRRVLVTGAGPIGVLTTAAARLAGAADITVTDILAEPLLIAGGLGADRVIDVAVDPGGLAAEVARGGRFDVHFEAAGSAAALLSGLAELKPKGICVLIGQGAELPLQVSSLIGREIDLRGSFRFDREFQWAIGYLARGAIDTSRLITATMPASDAIAAFDLAADKSLSMKVQLDFA